ncbi:MAG: ATP-binding protein [Isosphaeraceae bacterium]
MAEDDARDTLERLIDLGHLSSGIGHHVINAFSAVVSNAELLRLDPPMPSIADPAVLADTIIRTALEASTVARKLIDYTRSVTSIEPDRAAYQPDSLRLDELVAEFVEEEKTRAPANVGWRSNLTSVPPVKGHRPQLQSMLSHIVRNSYEAFAPSGGEILVSTSTDSRDWIVLEIRDTGRGMETSTLERASEPFFSTKPGHLGIGLSIANGIWRRHRGTLAIQSRPGEGTRLRLCVEPFRSRSESGFQKST